MNSIVESIINKYPNIDQNSLFLNDIDIVSKDFNEEEIINIHKYLDRNNIWYLYMYLYSYSLSSEIREMIKYIAKTSPNTINEIFLNSCDNINKKLFETYSKLVKFDNNSNFQLDINNIKFSFDFVNYLIFVKRKYKNRELTDKELTQYMIYARAFIIKRFLKDYKDIDENVINSVAMYILSDKVSISKLYNYYMYNGQISDIIGHGKFNIEKSKNINPGVIDKIKISYVSNILNILKNSNFDKFTHMNRDDLINIIIKMIATINYQNTEKIFKEYCDDIRILRIMYAFNDIDLSKCNDIIYKNSFINFIVGKNLNDKNSIINKMLDNDTDLASKLNFLFNYWEEIEKRFNKQTLYTKTAFIERLLSVSRIFFEADEYKLEGDIINSYIDNKRHQSLEIDDIIEEVRKTYKEMKHNYHKTIPYISGDYENYSYETLKADDPVLFSVGASTDNCFKIGGQATSFVKYCALNPNGRVVVIKDKKNNIVAMIPMVRNGNLVLCNSIESNYVNDTEFMKKMFEILKIIGDSFIQMSEEKEDKNTCIKAVLVGNYKNKIDEITDLEKESELPFEVLSTNDALISSNLGGFDYTNYFVSKSHDYNYRDITSFNSSIRYLDPRDEVLDLEVEQLNEEVVNLLNSIKYESCGNVIDTDNIYRVIFNKDWFILIDKNFNVESYIVGKDKRAYVEYNEYLSLVSEFIKNAKEENYKVI